MHQNHLSRLAGAVQAVTVRMVVICPTCLDHPGCPCELCGGRGRFPMNLIPMSGPLPDDAYEPPCERCGQWLYDDTPGEGVDLAALCEEYADPM